MESILRFGGMQTLLFLLYFSIGGCMPGPQMAAGGQSSSGSPATTGPLTEVQWSELEARGQTIAQQTGAANHVSTERLQGQGYVVQHTLQLTGGWCYAAAITWAAPSQANVSLMFDVGPNGNRVNEQLGGRRENMSPPGGVLQFCADNDGPANLSISALSAGGAVDPNALLQFALVLGGGQESPEEAIARRQSEATRGATAQAQIDTNIAAAEARDAQNQADRCRRCREDLVRCREAGALGVEHRSQGITTANSCEGQFRQCGFSSLTEASRAPDEWPCGR